MRLVYICGIKNLDISLYIVVVYAGVIELTARILM